MNPRVPAACILLLLLAHPALGQTPEAKLKEAWAHLATHDLSGEPGAAPERKLRQSIALLAQSWAVWLEAQPGPDRAALPDLPFPDVERRPTLRRLARRGEWWLLGLEIPVPCGSHTILALVQATRDGMKVRGLDTLNPPREIDVLGARENLQALLLPGPKVAVASTPPWCTSCWSRLDIRVWKPGATSETPTVLANWEDSVYRCADKHMAQLSWSSPTLHITYMGESDPERVFRKRSHQLRVP